MIRGILRVVRQAGDLVPKGANFRLQLIALLLEALEGDLVIAALTAGLPPEYVDRTGTDAAFSGRMTMAKSAKQLIEKAAAPKMVPPTPPQP